MTTAPPTMTGSSRLALNLAPAADESTSMASIVRTRSKVPAGIRTPAGLRVPLREHRRATPACRGAFR